MDMKRFFLYAIVIAALALAGCGGNGGGGMTGPVDPDPTPCPSGQVGTPPDCAPAPPTVADLFEDAQNAEDAAQAAITDAKAAVKAATEASEKLGVLTVVGNSMKAQMNAQAVLDNQTKTKDAYDAAVAALDDLEEADTAADQHNNTALNNAIADAIEVAEDAIKSTKAEVDGSTLKDAVTAVTGTDTKKPGTAADVGQGVATEIMNALKPTNADSGVAANIDHVVPTADQAKNGNEIIDRRGMTWKEIVGAANVKEISIGKVVGSGTMTVEASSVSGKTITFDQDGVDVTKNEITKGSQYSNNAATDADVTYMGIPGTVYCAGSDCVVEAGTTDSRELTGSWYFTPYSQSDASTPVNNSKTSYIKATPTATTYTAEENYVRYGYWLETETDNNNATEVNTYADLGANPASKYTTNNDSFSVGTVADVDKSATYEGDAIGMSLHKTFNSQGDVVKGSLKSAEFTANVSLTAEFGSSPTLRGKITNFDGDAVGSDWEVTFLNTAFANGSLTGGVAVSSGQNGVWTARAYGGSSDVDANATKRPLGIFGTFDTHFSNGNAAGAYTTRKQ